MNVENRVFHRDRRSTFTGAVEPARPRSEGVLSPDQVRWCREHGVALAFDPVQIGWVTQDCEDDLSPPKPARPEFVFHPWRHEDAPVLAAMLSSEGLWHYLPEDFRGPIDEQAAAQLIELGGEEHHEVLAVLGEGVPIGQVRLLFSGEDAAELSYWLGEDHWGKGYATSIVRDYCERSRRAHPEIRRLFARVHEGHGASQRVLEKTGFARTARDGVWIIFEKPQSARH